MKQTDVRWKPTELARPVVWFVRWLFGAPFGHLPPRYGDTVPPELRRFEAEADAVQYDAAQAPAPARAEHERSTPAREDPALEHRGA